MARRFVTATLLVPVLNEIRGLRIIMPRVPEVTQVLVLDGGSTDGSVRWCLDQGYEVYTQHQHGLRFGFCEALEKVRGDVIVTFSPDGNSDPTRIAPLLAEMQRGYDMVIVSRYLPPAVSEDDTPLTRAANWTFTQLINRLFGGHYTDALVLFRAYRRTLVEELGISAPRADWWERRIGRYISWEPMLSIRAAKAGCRVGEIPGDEPHRIGDKQRGWLLPESRIHHVKSGAAMAWLVAEEAVRR